MARGNPNPNRATQFKKGHSGNPGGVSKIAREIKDICREAGPVLVARLLDIAKNGEPLHAIPAAKELLNRGFGKSENLSTVRIEAADALTDDELNARIAELEAKRGPS
jgi:F0F1-type ATP synthase delta subunit